MHMHKSKKNMMHPMHASTPMVHKHANGGNMVAAPPAMRNIQSANGHGQGDTKPTLPHAGRSKPVTYPW